MSLPPLFVIVKMMTWRDSCTIFQGTHLWFKTHEPQSIAALLIPLLFTSSCISVFWIASVGVYNIWKAYLIFLGAILGSITFYRLSPFHPLARYPGPILFKMSKLWSAFAAYQGNLQVYHKEMHEKYGPIVRVGLSLSPVLLEED